MKQKWLIALLPLIISGCVSTNSSNPQQLTQQQLDNSLGAQQAQLQQHISDQQQALQTAQQQQTEALQQQITALQQQIKQLQPAKSEAKPAPVVCEPVPESAIGDKMVFGETEWVTAPDYQRRFDARVDTGATSTSMLAINIKSFERDGADWVSFELPADGDKPVTYEAKVAHYVAIKKASADETERRPVIMVRLQIGDFNGVTEVNLADRSHMEFPLLLGRKFFKDIAVVDVSKQYVQSQ